MAKRIIMVEGCDRTGKSTFITYLESELKKIGKEPFVFHLTGPTQFDNIAFNLDEKSLVQLAKFNDEYEMIKQILAENPDNVVILDRTSFDEFVWTKYWNRIGKYTDYVNSTDFYKRHYDLFDQSVYIEYYISNIETLKNRILESPTDTTIFTNNGKTIEENIEYVYDLYEDLKLIIKDQLNITYHKYDNIGSLDKVARYANFIVTRYFGTPVELNA